MLDKVLPLSSLGQKETVLAVQGDQGYSKVCSEGPALPGLHGRPQSVGVWALSREGFQASVYVTGVCFPRIVGPW